MFRKLFGAEEAVSCSGESGTCGAPSACSGEATAPPVEKPIDPKTKKELLAAYSTVFDFEAVDIHEQNQKLSKYKGNVTLVVNVASY